MKNRQSIGFTIHRGTHEIGGTVIQVREGGESLLLDFGIPLVQAGTEERLDWRAESRKTGPELVACGILPDIAGLYRWDERPLTVVGLLLSHAHLDHYGLVNFVKDELPIYASSTTIKLMDVSAVFLPDVEKLSSLKPIQAFKKASVGAFTVMAYPVDHSAPGALAFNICAGGKNLFYTGDLRGHGRYEKLFPPLLERPPKAVDVLLMEGTMMSRPGEQAFPTERSVEDAVAERLKEDPGPALLFSSSQNIQRIISLHQACKTAGRTLVIDLYTAFVLYRLRDEPIGVKNTQVWSENIKVIAWGPHYEKVKGGEFKAFVNKAFDNRITLEEIAENPGDCAILSKDNSLLGKTVPHLGDPKQLQLIWSLWGGYLEEPGNRVRAFAEEHNLVIHHIHTSGHAVVEDLEKVVDAIKPRALVPVHTFHPEHYSRFNAEVKCLEDGEWYDVI